MNLKQQLLLVSLLTLVLPWAGVQFIRETESALRAGQQQMLAGTARAVADSLAQYAEEFPPTAVGERFAGDQLYGHELESKPEIDGYFDDWTIARKSLRTLRGSDGPVRFALGLYDEAVYLYVEVSDRNIVYATPTTAALESGSRYADRISVINTSPPYREEALTFAAEAPGSIVAYLRNEYGFAPDPTVLATWQDVPGGYQLEARIPASKLGTHLGIVVSNTTSELAAPVRSASFSATAPGRLVTTSVELSDIAADLAQPGMRLIVTDLSGWRIATGGDIVSPRSSTASAHSAWLRIAYNALVKSGQQAELAEPDPGGREQQSYIVQALGGQETVSWFRSADSGRAVVAVAQPITTNNRTLGAVVLQQGTDAILSLTNQGLARLINVTLIATLLVAFALLGYASWLSRRISSLSIAAEEALDGGKLRTTLPSALAGDEVGDLSRSFSHVLRQLGEYNDYLRSLASKLSHELRTPLAIVTSSLENLEHEPLNSASADYAARAKGGADRLRRILTAMSEASRVEELMQHAEPEEFDLCKVLESTAAAYRDVYPKRTFELTGDVDDAVTQGSPELLIQMLDKLVDNAVDFSGEHDVITIGLSVDDSSLQLTISNPGPKLPEKMRSQLFDSMVSVRPGAGDKHLGLGLYIAKLIAEGHGGKIQADNTDVGVRFTVDLPRLR
ncbi:MAG: ATP-binding protein [Gammaproteobacteria bacterium]|nr:ATP-binding protein [Gammaproteobacteria bacterium]MDH3415188.1 ATP-binding protein [Gammaproteobacteria bacterium]